MLKYLVSYVGLEDPKTSCEDFCVLELLVYLEVLVNADLSRERLEM